MATRHARFIFEPEENRLSRSPGDFARVSPNHPGTGPTSPATLSGVSVMGRSKYRTGFMGGDFTGIIFLGFGQRPRGGRGDKCLTFNEDRPFSPTNVGRVLRTEAVYISSFIMALDPRMTCSWVTMA